MKKTIAFLLVMLCAASLFIAFPQKAIGQTTDMKVLNYSWYISAQTGNFIVVGELQNTGSNNIGSAPLYGFVYAKDGELLATTELAGSLQVYATIVLPNQKVPFYMEFPPESSPSGNLTWVSLGIGRVDFNIYENPTNATPYSGLQIVQDTSYVDPTTGNYTVIGVLQNNGEGYPENVWAVATFYNSSGSVIAVGFSNFVTPHFLPPTNSSSFMLIPNDPTPEMASEIASYSLQILTDGSTTQPAPSPSSSASSQPSSSPTTSVAPSTSSSAPTSSSSVGEPSVPLSYVYAIIAAFVIAIAVIALAFMLRKRTKTGTK